MILAVIIVLYLLSSVFEAFEEISATIAPVMNSGVGMAITVIVTAYITYRWYRARHSA